jgi:Na+/melibiose symporter-like transporter
MFAMFPYLSIYLQDIDGESPLGAGLRFLPITAFVFLVPLATRKLGARVPMWVLLAVSLAIVTGGLLLLEPVSVGDSWTVLLPGFIVCGIGIGLANPTIAQAALRVVDPTRTGMASGISNTARVGGLALGVAGLGAFLQHRIQGHLTAAGFHGKAIAAAVSSSGLRAAAGNASLRPVANAAFVSGFRLIILLGAFVVFGGVLAAAALVRRRAQAPAPAPASAP